jgi:hypothetical protein
MKPVWAAPYPTGFMVAGRMGPLDARAAYVNSAPSSEVDRWRYRPDEEFAGSFVAQLGVQISPEMRLAASFDHGPYLDPDHTGTLAAYAEFDDYNQEIWSLEGTLTRGHVEARAEVLIDRWEVPNVSEDPRDISYTAEARARLSPRFFVVGRYGAIRFPELEEGRWDYDVDRAEVGAGLRMGRTTELRGEYLRTWTASPVERDDDMFTVRWSYRF